MYPFAEIRMIRDRLIANGETVAVAESVTSGHLQAALSLAEDARRFFQGGITAYNIGQKSRHLLIEPIEALECNCVSERIAGQMALQAGRLFTSTYGLGITGYAAEVPEKGIFFPFAFFSIAKEGNILLTRKVENAVCQERKDMIDAGHAVWSVGGAPPAAVDSFQVQVCYTRQVLETMAQLLLGTPKDLDRLAQNL